MIKLIELNDVSVQFIFILRSYNCVICNLTTSIFKHKEYKESIVTLYKLCKQTKHKLFDVPFFFSFDCTENCGPTTEVRSN